MTKLYIVRRYGTKIYTVEAEKVTDKTYTYLWNGKLVRSYLHTEYDDTYLSWEDAHKALIERIQSSLDATRQNLIRLERDLEEVQAMAKPTEA